MVVVLVKTLRKQSLFSIIIAHQTHLHTIANVYYQSFVHMCVTAVKVKELPGVWASPVCPSSSDRSLSLSHSFYRCFSRYSFYCVYAGMPSTDLDLVTPRFRVCCKEMALHSLL